MYLSCASVCYRGYAPDEIETMLTHAPHAGFRHVDVHGPLTWSPAAIDRFDAPKWRQRIEAAGLKCAGIYSPGFGGANPEQIERHALAIAKAAVLCAELGGTHVVSTGATPRGSADLSSVMECVRRILELVPTEMAVTFGLEPHYRNILERTEDYERFFAVIDHPLVGLCVDTGHFHAAKQDTVGIIRRFGSRIVDVHLKDHIGTQSVAIGHGEVNLPEVFGALKEVGYTGSVTLELEVEDTNNAPCYVEEAYALLSGLIT